MIAAPSLARTTTVQTPTRPAPTATSSAVLRYPPSGPAPAAAPIATSATATAATARMLLAGGPGRHMSRLYARSSPRRCGLATAWVAVPAVHHRERASQREEGHAERSAGAEPGIAPVEPVCRRRGRHADDCVLRALKVPLPAAMSRVSGKRRSGGIGARDGARLVQQFAGHRGGSAAIGMPAHRNAARPDAAGTNRRGPAPSARRSGPRGRTESTHSTRLSDRFAMPGACHRAGRAPSAPRLSPPPSPVATGGGPGPAPRTLAGDDEQVRRARLLLPAKARRLLPLDRGALAIELDDEQTPDPLAGALLLRGPGAEEFDVGRG
jgi:hypothetical protein